MSPNRRYLFLALFLAFVFACNLIAPAPTATPAMTPTPLPPLNPQVIDHFPGRGDELKVDGAIDVYFDMPMDRASVERAFSISPSVTGAFEWLDDETLRFTPASPLERASRYTVTIDRTAKSRDGLTMADSFNFEVKTVGLLEVTQVLPAPDTTEAPVDSPITVMFNRPVMPLTALGDQSSLPQPLTLSPAVAGTGEWLNTSIFVFTPHDALPGGTTFTGTIAQGLTDTTGGLLVEEYRWTFATPAPQVISTQPFFGDVDIALTSVITVTFNQPMDHASTEAAFHLLGPAGELPGAFRWDDAMNSLGFVSRDRLDLGTTYTINVDAGAASKGGGATLGQQYSSTFTTVEYPRVVSTTPADGDRSVDLYAGFAIRFSAPMDVSTLDDQITIIPAPTQVYTYWSDYDKSYNVNWDFEPSTDYTVTLGPDMADLYGNTVGEETVVEFTTRALEPTAYLNTNGNIGTYNAYRDTSVYVVTRNLESLDFALYQLTPATFARLVGPNSYDEQQRFSPDPSTLVRRWHLPVKSELNQQFLTKVDLVEGGGALVPGVYYLEMDPPEINGHTPAQKYFLVVSGVNLTIKLGLNEALVWATDLNTGLPIPNLPISMHDQNFSRLGSGLTDSDGLYKIALSDQPDLYTTVYAVADGNAPCPLPLASCFTLATSQWSQGIEPWDFGVSADFYGKNYEAYFYTDRPLYRPGQTVYWRGVIRSENDARFSLPDVGPISVTILNDQGEEVYSDTLKLSPFGTISGEFNLSDEAGTGYYNINATIPGEPDRSYGVGFQVAEYRKPEFLVRVTTDKSAVAQGETINAEIDSSFFFGGPVSNADVHWSLLSSSYFFDYTGPGGYFEFTDFDWSSGETFPVYGAFGELIAEGDGQTDADGKLKLQLPADLSGKTSSQTFTLEATVTDINGQQVSGRSSVIVHQGNFYIGLRPEQYVGAVGRPQNVHVVVSDWESKPIANQKLDVVFNKHEWFSVQEQDEFGNNIFTWDVRDTPVYTTSVTTGADGFGVVTFTPDEGGTYKVVATGRDSGGRTVRSSTILWIASGEYVSWRQENNDRINLITDRKSYAPGDTAEILIPSPFQGAAKALVTVERGRILQHEVIDLTTNSTTYQLPITADFAPDVFVSVVIVKGVDENNPAPAFRMGLAQLKVSPEQQEIKVTLTPDKEKVGPRDTVTYQLQATDYQGRPVQAEFSLGVSDLAALSLAPPNAGLILDTFYGIRPLGIRTSLGLTLSVDRLNIQAAEAKGGGGGGAEAAFFDVRETFLDTAYWNASVVTDENGQASVSVTLPDNLTTWRLDARGISADTLVGQSTVDIVATKDLLIRPVTPRFFVVGDKAQLAAVVNNNTANAIDAQVSLQASGVTIAGNPTQSVNLPANGRAQVTWNVTINDAAAADLTFSVQGGGLSDASKPTLGQPPDQLIPIYKYSAPETVGTAGQLSGQKSVTEAIALPRRFDVTQGQLSVQIDPSLAAGMTDGLDYLEHFPYECTEQTVSRFLPNVLTYRALKNLGISDPALETKLHKLVAQGVQKLYARVHVDGGWGWWTNDQSNPFITAYVLFGLVKAKEAGFTVSDNILQNAATYLESQIRPPKQIEATWELNRQAFMLYALSVSGNGDLGRTVQMYDERERLDTYAKAYLALTLKQLDPTDDSRWKNLLADFNNEAIVSATGAHWEEQNEHDWWNMNTDTRSTAIVLDALTQLDPEMYGLSSTQPLLPNVVRWLMVARKATGGWETTQETAWALIALTDWLAYSGELKPEYAYDVFLNGRNLSSGTATADNVREAVKLQIAVADLLKDEANRLSIERTSGDGQLYYTAHLTVYQNAADVQAVNRGLSVARQYTLPTGDCGGPRQPRCPAVTSATAGQDVKVTLTVVAPNDLYYVVVEDPFPAGMEPVDTSLLTTSVVGENPGYSDPWSYGWGWWWFSSTDLRDEKLVLFATWLPKGTYTYTYTLHASLPGTYNVIPPTGNEFYFPEVFGRGDGSVFEVKAGG